MLHTIKRATIAYITLVFVVVLFISYIIIPWYAERVSIYVFVTTLFVIPLTGGIWFRHWANRAVRQRSTIHIASKERAVETSMWATLIIILILLSVALFGVF